MSFPYWTWSNGLESIRQKLEGVINSWKGTPYAPGQQAKGIGVDCVRFVTGIMDEMSNTTHDYTTLPPDSYLHNPARSHAAVRQIIKLYAPFQKVIDGNIQPGDVLVVGPRQGGPGHAYIVGCYDNELWDATGPGVKKTSYAGALMNGMILHRAYRVLNSSYRWLQPGDPIAPEDLDEPDIVEPEPIP